MPRANTKKSTAYLPSGKLLHAHDLYRPALWRWPPAHSSSSLTSPPVRLRFLFLKNALFSLGLLANDRFLFISSVSWLCTWYDGTNSAVGRTDRD